MFVTRKKKQKNKTKTM